MLCSRRRSKTDGRHRSYAVPSVYGRHDHVQLCIVCFGVTNEMSLNSSQHCHKSHSGKAPPTATSPIHPTSTTSFPRRQQKHKHVQGVDRMVVDLSPGWLWYRQQLHRLSHHLREVDHAQIASRSGVGTATPTSESRMALLEVVVRLQGMSCCK